ncbi:dihydropteroate synthase [Erythrobacter crassostreae]|uniref:dihydropteroate synthase n=1 Tax=Erythrobacter crassostreae TaxID=2828328 RepID=A0A9X1F382_9SPHN|nr:dihydropteroate synthase [Erythrobacter crassostrea]MBV7259452.1 dihydropteroate synthase [Erythrobacter crassostrea]
MSASVYIHPIGFVSGPQAEDGAAIRLAGSMVYASRFALVVRDEGKAVARRLFGARGFEEVVAGLDSTLASEAERQWANLQKVHAPIELGERTIRLDQPQIMGVLNVTPDSFSDGGEFLEKPEAGRAYAAAMLESGAAIIDIGGESTRPGAAATWEGDEKDRVLPAVEYCASMGAAISVDTRRAGVLEAALQAGAHIANDVSALRYDPRSAELVASMKCPVILMHAPGSGDDLHEGGDYDDVVSDVFDFLRLARDRAIAGGIAEDRIMLDPGIGFGKTLADNLALINALPLFHALGSPLLLGVSRKRMIGALSNEEAAHQRLGGSIALAMKGMDAGIHMLRVHDVKETVQARNVWRGMRDAALTDFAQLPMD